MIIRRKFNTIQELQRLQRLATQCDEDVYIHSLDDTIKIDAKSFIGLFVLDLTQEVNVVTESEWLAKQL